MQGSPGSRCWLLVVLVIVAAVAAVIAVAFLVGDQSASNPTRDRAIQPIGPSPTTAHVLGIGALVVAAGVVVLVIRMTRSRASAGAWIVAVVSFIAAGGLVGFAYAAGSAQVIGANIGYGLIVLADIPSVPVALAFGIVAMVRGWQKHGQLSPIALG
jgi:hypothetical protein